MKPTGKGGFERVLDVFANTRIGSSQIEIGSIVQIGDTVVIFRRIGFDLNGIHIIHTWNLQEKRVSCFTSRVFQMGCVLDSIDHKQVDSSVTNKQ